MIVCESCAQPYEELGQYVMTVQVDARAGLRVVRYACPQCAYPQDRVYPLSRHRALVP
jgi:nitrate/TMAO reductase-like tetraheme cytochrome c subunit